MQETVLHKIVRDKAQWIAARQQQQPLAGFQNDIVPSERSFYHALQGTRTAFILECKKASPSKGLIRENFDPVEIATVYKDFASAISVLTDEKYFQGSFDFLPLVSKTVSQPVLCKDFIIDPYQIYLARYYQADAILLMLSVLTDEQYRQLAAVAHSLNMGVLTEVISEEELQRAIALEARVVGINNRDLRDLSIDLNRTRQLAPRVPHGVTVISESGINNYGQIRELSHYANGFLIGSALMSESRSARRRAPRSPGRQQSVRPDPSAGRRRRLSGRRHLRRADFRWAFTALCGHHPRPRSDLRRAAEVRWRVLRRPGRYRGVDR